MSKRLLLVLLFILALLPASVAWAEDAPAAAPAAAAPAAAEPAPAAAAPAPAAAAVDVKALQDAFVMRDNLEKRRKEMMKQVRMTE